MTELTFWFDYASTYSYLTAMRVDELAATRGVRVTWRPFLLGPVFKSQGWDTSPFNIYPAKGRYMIRDMERIAASRSLNFRLPAPFPQNSLRAARVAYALPAAELVAPFSRAVFHTEFAEGKTISEVDTLTGILSALGLNASAILAASETAEVKQRLRTATEQAMSAGIFGAPTLVTPDNEIFWGDDRLEPALNWLTQPST